MKARIKENEEYDKYEEVMGNIRAEENEEIRRYLEK